MSRHAIIAIVLAGAGVLGLIFTLTSHSSVRDDIAKDYRLVGEEKPPGREDSSRKPTLIYASPKSVSRRPRATSPTSTSPPTAARPRPARSCATATTSCRSCRRRRGRRGSRIFVDDEEGGYHRNYFFVGGFWGTYSGPAGSFRGGGPGAGK